MYDDSFGYKRCKETVRHAQSESAKCHQPDQANSAQTFVACDTAKRYLSGYIISQKRSVKTDPIYMYSYEVKPIYIYPYYEKVGNVTKGFTYSSLKVNVEVTSNTAPYW